MSKANRGAAWFRPRGSRTLENELLMPQFVILRHTLPAGAARASHFDLMLEHEGRLLTWAIAELPSATAQPADELAPHRLDYLSYEGPISNNRGEVKRVVEGEFDWLLQQADELAVQLHSLQLSGRLTLRRELVPRWLMWLI